MEDYFLGLSEIENKDVIIFCDRGMLDSFAYMNDSAKEKV